MSALRAGTSPQLSLSELTNEVLIFRKGDGQLWVKVHATEDWSFVLSGMR